MKLPDEAALRQQLHKEIDLAEISPAPVEAVFRRRWARRARRLAVITCGVAVIAAAAGMLAVRAPGWPGGAPPGTLGRPTPGTTLHTPNTPAQGGVFASGAVNGRKWRLAAVNLADPGYRCLPGVVVNGQSGDLLQPGFLPGLALGKVAFLATSPGRPGTGFAFLQLRPGVARVTADLGDGTRLGLRPVTVTVCGQRFRLAGFEYPRQGVTRITARSAQGHPLGYTPPAEYFSPASPFQDGTWINNVQGTTVASGQIGSGNIGGTSWGMTVTLGPDGECFGTQTGPAGPATGTSTCQPVSAPSKGASLTPIPFPLPARAVIWIWYPGTVNARTAYLLAHLSNGTTKQLAPTVVAGRKYFVLAVAQGIKLTRLTPYDTHRHPLAHITSFPPVK